jgi:hypothetical protein
MQLQMAVNTCSGPVLHCIAGRMKGHGHTTEAPTHQALIM